MSSKIENDEIGRMRSLGNLQADRLTSYFLRLRVVCERLHRIIRALVIPAAFLAFSQVVAFYPVEIAILLCIGLAFVAYWFPRFSVAMGALLMIPAYFYQDLFLGAICLGLILLTVYFSSKDWRIGAITILVVSAMTAGPFYLAGAMLVIFCSILLGRKFGTSTSVLTILWILVLLTAKGVGIGLVPMPALGSSALQQPTLSLNQFNPASLVSIFMLRDASQPPVDGNSNASGQTLIDAHFYEALAGPASVFFYLNLVAWMFVGFIPAYIVDRTPVKNKIVLFSLGSLAGVVAFLVPNAMAVHWNSQFLAPNIVSDSQIVTLTGFSVLTIILAVFLSPLFNPFDRFMYSEWKEVSKATAFLYPLGPFDSFQLEVGGYEKVKTAIAECILWPLERKDLIETYGLEPPTGALVLGCHGVGKTKLVLGCAARTRAAIFVLKCAEVDYSMPDKVVVNLEEVFDILCRFRPCVAIFLDVEKLLGAGIEVQENIKWAFLDGLDKIRAYDDVIPVGITEFDGLVDRAVLAPGKLERIIYVNLPDASTREAMFRSYLRGRPCSQVDFSNLARRTEGFVDLEIEEVAALASLKAAGEANSSRRTEPITNSHLIEALNGKAPRTSEETRLAFDAQFERMKEQAAGIRVRVKLRELLKEP